MLGISINTHSVNILVYFWTTLDWYSIKILIDTQSTLVWQLVDSWQSVKCQPTQIYMSTLSGVSVKIRWLSTDCWPRSWLCVDWVVMKRLINLVLSWWRVSQEYWLTLNHGCGLDFVRFKGIPSFSCLMGKGCIISSFWGNSK